MARELPARPHLDHLRKQAKALLRDRQHADPHTTWQLADAQHELARDYGFASWPKLKAHVDALTKTVTPAQALTNAIRANHAADVKDVLEQYPELRDRLNEPLADYDFRGTALVAATQRTNLAVIDILLAAGADINGKSHWWAGGYGVLDEADPAFAPALIARGAVVHPHAAARLGMIDTLKDLIASDPDTVHVRGPDGQLPLHGASTIEIARLLLDHGADIDGICVDHESTAAQYMLRETQTRHFPRDRQNIARELVARGCRTDLLMATALGDIDRVRGYLDADPELIRMKVSDQFFPRRDPRAGGSIYIWVLGRNRTAHTVARDFGHERIYELLLERSPADLRFALACELGDEATFRAMLAEQPALVSTLAETDRAKIVDAAESNNTNAVRLMTEAGWPLDARGSFQATALHWAGFHGNAVMVDDLIRAGAPVRIRGDQYDSEPIGWTGFGSVHSWRRDVGDYPTAVRLLLDAGATPPDLHHENFEASDAVRAVLTERQETR